MSVYQLEFSPDTCPEVGLLDHMVSLIFLKDISIMFSLMTVPFTFPPALPCSGFSTFLPVLVIVFFYYTHLSGGEVVAHYGLDLYFPND